ncbi:Uncharacterised protein [Candidatus Tiddalikarchaeum anstoanum]|nr:Uncharacterised protein [Candidatus Tiddalikarchaeum anstoanum]
MNLSIVHNNLEHLLAPIIKKDTILAKPLTGANFYLTSCSLNDMALLMISYRYDTFLNAQTLLVTYTIMGSFKYLIKYNMDNNTVIEEKPDAKLAPKAGVVRELSEYIIASFKEIKDLPSGFRIE